MESLSKSHNRKPRIKKTVFQYDSDKNLIRKWESGSEAARNLNVIKSSINKFAKSEKLVIGKKSKLKGYIFSYRNLTNN